MNANLEETTKKELTMNIRKRNGEMEPFNSEKITRAIYKAAVACGGKDYERAEYLTREVEKMLSKHDDEIVDIETIQDYVEKALIENGHAKTAKAYILYREKRKTAREMNALTGAIIGMFGNYLSDSDWQVQENANVTKSVNGLNNYVREEFTKLYWLSEIYPNQVSEMHKRGDAHLHDLGLFGPYCAGWDLRQLAREGFGGVAKKVSSAPAKHFRAFLGQIVNSTFTTQGETAGAQAWSSFDTICAPFVYYDGLDYKQVRQAIQEFIFNMNVPTRVGFQCPFSNLTFDIKVPSTLKDEPVIIGGEYKDKKYGDFQKEMNMINKAFCEVMYKGDNSGQVFTFPIPTLNITKDFDWDNEVVDDFMKITLRYGNPYFANYVNSDLSPEDALSMCPLLGDTKVIVKNSYGEVSIFNIDYIYNQFIRGIEYEIWTPEGWCKGIPNRVKMTDVYKITFSNGVEVRMGEQHLQPVMGGKVFSAKDLKVGMWIPFNLNVMNFENKGNYNLGLAIGAFLGDGSYSENEIVYSFNNSTKLDITEKIMYFWDSMGMPVSTNKTKSGKLFIRIGGKSAEYIKYFVDGDTSLNKKIGNNCFRMSEEFKKGVIDGLQLTDGSREKKRIYTSSNELRMSLTYLLASLGRKYNINYIDTRDGRYGENPNYRIDCPERDNYGEIYKTDSIYNYYKIVSIEKVSSTKEYLYCFEIDNKEHLFTLANGLVTHNCRLRLDMTELRKRGGGLFGSNPLTGSVGVVTINLPRIGYLSETKEEYFKKLKEVADIAKESLEIKRKILEQQTENGLYPYSAKYLKDVKLRTGKYWSNHFSTIGVIGMEESLRNFKPVGKALYTKEGQEFAKEVMNYLRDVITSYQEETGNVYNLEATPAEGTSHRLALIDKKRYPDIITAGSKEVPYYTNSTQLPVGYTDDLFETLELQDDLQCMYTGGTVLHGYTGDKLEDIETLKTLIKTVFTKFKLPYFSYTPTFSICPEHGYILGEHFECPECGAKTEVWSRVVGYLRPVSGFNNGKLQEYFERNKYSMENFLNDIE